VKVAWIIVLALGLAGSVGAQDQPVSADELIKTADAWAKENLDASVLTSLQQVDRDRVKAVLDDLLRRFQSDSVYDLSAIKETATALLPILDSFEETDPYARWLRARLDYLTTADDLRREFNPPAPEPGQPTPSSPLPAAQRRVWVEEMKGRPLPERAEALVSKLKPIFIEAKLPAELIWLAEVESSFDPRAKSPVGAAGLFQLMKPTAKDLGLSTWLPDERLDPEKNGRAAAKHLRHLHDRFDDWELALAAYNAGEGRVSRLLKKSDIKTFDAIAGRLPAETQMYVPKFEAVLQKRTGIQLKDLKAPADQPDK
jgi:membrane-bound lytic murein transglycosylase D